MTTVPLYRTSYHRGGERRYGAVIFKWLVDFLLHILLLGEIDVASKRTLTENIKTKLNNKLGSENAESSLKFLREFYKKIFVSCTPEHSSGSSGTTPGYRQSRSHQGGLQFNELSDKLVELKFRLSERDSPKEVLSEDNSPSWMHPTSVIQRFWFGCPSAAQNLHDPSEILIHRNFWMLTKPSIDVYNLHVL